MTLLTEILIAFVALQHLGFLVLEMFFWTKPLGRRVFGMKADFAEQSKALAANQGLYNGFLAAGLLWGLLLGADGFPEKVFFLSCVIVAGVFGGATVSKRIVIVQAVPALLALVLLYLSR